MNVKITTRSIHSNIIAIYYTIRFFVFFSFLSTWATFSFMQCVVIFFIFSFLNSFLLLCYVISHLTEKGKMWPASSVCIYSTWFLFSGFEVSGYATWMKIQRHKILSSCKYCINAGFFCLLPAKRPISLNIVISVEFSLFDFFWLLSASQLISTWCYLFIKEIFDMGGLTEYTI